MILRTSLIVGTAIVSSLTSLAAERKTAARKQALPNIVFVLADDMGIGDLGCYGQQKIRTPHIDSLAAHSLRFTHHYAGSTVSAPSRCCLLTGKHTGHSAIRGNRAVRSVTGSFDLPLPDEEVTVAELLKTKGYATMCVGKWGLGGPGTTGSPINQGFDYFFGYLGQGTAHRYYPDHLYENERKVELDGTVYSHFLIMEKGLEFMDRHADRPFFAYFAITPPHADLDYPDLSAYEHAFPETPLVNKSDRGFKTQLKPKAAYASMVSEIDRSVGAIVELLKRRGIWENTILIFSSDNGVHCVGGHDPDFFDSNGPFRGYKRDLYEGGVRTPFLVSWPEVITRPRETDHVSAFWDFLPTVTRIVGCEIPEGVDGISYLPVLEDNESEQSEHGCIYYEFYEKGGKQSILKDGWKLVRLNLTRPDALIEELYFLPDDESETRNLADEYPEKLRELKRLADSVRMESPFFKWEPVDRPKSGKRL